MRTTNINIALGCVSLLTTGCAPSRQSMYRGPVAQPEIEAHINPYAEANYTTLVGPDASGCEPKAINDSGEIVGVYYDDHLKRCEGFQLRKGIYTVYKAPRAEGGTYLTQVDANGVATGYMERKVDMNGDTIRWFKLNNGRFHAIAPPNGALPVPGVRQEIGFNTSGVNDQGDVVGTFTIPSCTGGDDVSHGYLFSHHKLTILNGPQGATFSYAHGINHQGEIVGDFYDQKRCCHGFIFSKGQYKIFDHPHAALDGASIGTHPNGINSQGQIVGIYEDGVGRNHNFLLTPSAR